ncbi:MAG: hypothetical protein V4618_17235 [Pseudomonadota bacterium]
MTLLKTWTIQRAAGIGTVAGLIAVLLWPAYGIWPHLLELPFIAALAVASLCGGSILWITLQDIAGNRGRGNRVVPIRVFDVILALVLTVPCVLELWRILPDSFIGWGSF